MFSLETMMPPGMAVTYLVNLALAVSLVGGAGLVAARLCRRGSAPLQHGVLLWTLLLMLISPAAVWLAQQNGSALIRITVADAANASTGTVAEEGLAAELPSPFGRGAAGEGGASDALIARQDGSLTHSPHSSPLPAGARTKGRSDLHRGGTAAGLSTEKSPYAVGESSVTHAEKPATSWWWSTASVVALLWAVGTAVGLMRLVWGYLALARFCRRLEPLAAPRQKLLAHQAADAVGLRKLPAVFLSPSTGVPVSIGLLRPVIVLPAAMPPETDDEQLHAVLLHEMAHIARRDHWVGVGQRLATVLFWWNPLVHRICEEISEIREEICDNYVVLAQGEGRRLACILVELAARVTTGPLLPSTIGVLEPKLAGLTGRVIRLLNKERNMETRMNFGAKVAVFACALVLLIGMATIGGLGLAHAAPTALASAEKKPAAPAGSVTDLWQAAVERLSHRLELGGRVVDPDGKPLAGAKIYLLANRDELSYASPAEVLPNKVRAVSGADGHFAFTMEGSEFVVPSRYGAILVALADGFGPGAGYAWNFEPAGILISFTNDVSGAMPGEYVGKPVLRLAKDDVPLVGRIVDGQGKPVVGATIRALNIMCTTDGDLTAWLNGVEKTKVDFPAQFSYFRETILADQFPRPLTARTGADGKFRLAGIGRERIVELFVEGPAIESVMISARTRPGATIVVSDRLGSPNGRDHNFYGGDFTFVASPSIPIVGTVKDKDTGKPLPGVTIYRRAGYSEYGPKLADFVRTTTDAKGQFRLCRAPIGKQVDLVAVPPFDQPYLCAGKRPAVSAKEKSCKVDFQLKRGVWLRGKVTDEKTGLPLQAGVRYFCFRDNPHCKSAPDLETAWPTHGCYWTDRDGSYAVPALPGRGIVAINLCGYEHFCYSSGVGLKKIPGGHVSPVWDGQGGMIVFDTVHFCMAQGQTALAEVNPVEGAESVRHDFRLVSASRLVGTVLDPQGKPLPGAYYSGFSPTSQWFYWPAVRGRFAVNGYSPDQPRTVLLVDVERKLAGSVILQGPQTSPPSVKLQPWGVVTGRVVDKDGKPMPGLMVARYQFKKATNPHEGYLPADLFQQHTAGEPHMGNTSGFPTDRDGRFRIEGLAAGIKYSAWVWDEQGELLGDLISGVTTEVGQTKDLGNLTVKPFENNPSMRRQAEKKKKK